MAVNERIMRLVPERFHPKGLFKDIAVDLYRANMIMTASEYIAYSTGISVIVAVLFSLLITLFIATFNPVLAPIGLALIIPLFFMTLLLMKIQPKSKVKSRSDSFSRELPFALRHMATQLSSGSGLLETMRSISRSDYGVLSEEFKRGILEIDRGASIEEAYERMNLRIESEGLKKASRQIISTLRTGGNLANTLKLIAEEISNEMRMKLKDFIQILNTFALMFMFLVIVAPVLMTTLVIAIGIAMKSLPIAPPLMWVLYSAFFGGSLYLSFMVKRFEPKV